jgi:hypothetical protein
MLVDRGKNEILRLENEVVIFEIVCGMVHV